VPSPTLRHRCVSGSERSRTAGLPRRSYLTARNDDVPFCKGIAGQARNDGADIEIYNVVGQVVFTSQLSKLSPETTIDISHLANGLYFLKVDGKMVKIVKE